MTGKESTVPDEQGNSSSQTPGSDEFQAQGTQATATDTTGKKKGDEPKGDEFASDDDVSSLVDDISFSKKEKDKKISKKSSSSKGKEDWQVRDRELTRQGKIKEWIKKAYSAETQGDLEKVLEEAPDWVIPELEQEFGTEEKISSSSSSSDDDADIDSKIQNAAEEAAEKRFRKKEFESEFRKHVRVIENKKDFDAFSKKAKEIHAELPNISAKRLFDIAISESGIKISESKRKNITLMGNQKPQKRLGSFDPKTATKETVSQEHLKNMSDKEFMDFMDKQEKKSQEVKQFKLVSA